MTVIDASALECAHLLDCMQATFVLLAGRYHGPCCYLALGADLRFAPRSGGGKLPTIELPLEDHLIAAQRWLGLRIKAQWRVSAAPKPSTLLAGHDSVYIVADAFYLPWVPYFARRHMDHSFLVEYQGDKVAVFDGYHNDTQWGPARPGTWNLSDKQLAEALPNGADAVALVPTDSVGSLPQPQFTAPDAESVTAYLRAYRDYSDRMEALEQLTLETWLMARYRQLHAALHKKIVGTSTQIISDHLAQWNLLVEQTYLAYRRIQRGRPEPGGVIDRLAELLAADAMVFGKPNFRDRVATEVATVLGVAKAELLAGATLPSFPTFNSFRLVEIVERLEDRLCVGFDPDDLVPENLHCIDDLCRIASRHLEEPT